MLGNFDRRLWRRYQSIDRLLGEFTIYARESPYLGCSLVRGENERSTLVSCVISRQDRERRNRSFGGLRGFSSGEKGEKLREERCQEHQGIATEEAQSETRCERNAVQSIRGIRSCFSKSQRGKKFSRIKCGSSGRSTAELSLEDDDLSSDRGTRARSRPLLYVLASLIDGKILFFYVFSFEKKLIYEGLFFSWDLFNKLYLLHCFLPFVK